MLQHYVLIAWLNVRRGPLTASINIATLALGLVCFILAAAIAGFWTRADLHFANADRTVVMTSAWQFTDGSGTSSGVALPLTNDHLARYLQADFPQIAAVARATKLAETIPVSAGERALRLRGFAADAQFLEIFDLPFTGGDSRNALKAPGSVVVTKEAARALYGRTDVVGRPIMLFGTMAGTITGVIDRVPEPSHMGQSAASPMRFDALVSRDLYEQLVRAFTGGRDTTELPADWLNGRNTTYVMLPDDGSFSLQMLRDQLPAFVQRHVPPAQRTLTRVEFGAVPVSNLLGMAVRDALFPQERALSVPLFLLVLGAIVLAVACINFANLATARAATRAKEVGVRKAIGAKPRQVMVQYLLEAGVLTAAALLLALLLLVLLLPLIERTTGMDLAVLWSFEFAGRVVALLLALGIAVTLAAGFYPAFVLSRVRPAVTVRTGPAQSSSRLLMGVLVAVQFTFAAFLLIAVSIASEQNDKLQRAAREIGGESLLVIDNTPQLTGLPQEALRQALLRLPGVVSDTAMETLPWTNEIRRIPLSSSPSATAVQRSAHLYIVGHDFFSAFDVALLAGRLFDSNRPDDVMIAQPNPSRPQNLVISRALTEELGFGSPQEVVGRTIYIPTSVTGESAARAFHIIGVVENKTLNIASRYGARPSVYLFGPMSQYHVVRISTRDVRGTLAAIDALWTRLVPNVAPNRRFVADYFNDSYASFARVNQAFTALALIAWVISTIGLYAMAILVSGRRLHEIAIRKTLGARTSQIVLMLLKNFTAPVVIANLVAWPFAYVAGRAYLNVFIDPIALTPWPFLIALAISLLIAWIAVGGQTWRAAKAPPAKVMRYE